MDSKKKQCTNTTKLIFFTLSSFISTIIVLAIAFNSPNHFGTKTVLFVANFIFLVPAWLGLLTIACFREQQRWSIACFYAVFFPFYYPVVLLCFLVWSMIEDRQQSFVLTIGLGVVMSCQALAIDRVMDVVVGDDDDLSVLPAELQ